MRNESKARPRAADAERDRPDEAPRRGETQLDEIFEAAPIGMAQTDPADRRFLSVNPALCRITGYSEAELLDMTVDDLNHPDDQETDRDRYRRLVEDDAPYTPEKRYLRKDGSTAWVRVHGGVLRDAEGRPSRAFALIQDVTEARDALEALRLSEVRQVFLLGFSDRLGRLDDVPSLMRTACEMLRTELKVARVGCVEVEPDAKTVITGGVFREEWITLERGARVAALEPELARAFRAGKQSFRDGSESTPRSAALPRRDRMVGTRWTYAVGGESWGWTEHERQLLRSAAARLWHAVERMRAEKRLHTARRAAERANQAKSQFLAMVSHELRTPLTGVIGHARLLEEGIFGELSPDQLDAIRRIRTGSWHLSSIIEEILSFSRAESGREEVRWEESDLAALAREVIEVLRPQAREAGQSIQFEETGDGAPVRTDPAKVRKILVNLVGNAIKYAPDGRIDVHLEHGASSVRLYVRDRGPGIASEERERIFEPFTRAHRARPSPSGTGLGLAICRRLARLIGGRVSLESTLGEGSTFILKLPR